MSDNRIRRQSSSQDTQFNGKSHRQSTAPRRSNQQKPPQKRKAGLTGSIAIGVVAVIIVVLAAVGVYQLVMLGTIEATVNGETVELRTGTRYKDLHGLGYLVEAPGDLLAVDASVLEVGGGADPVVYLFGEPLGDLEATVEEGDIITEARGADVTEPIDTEETITPRTVSAQNWESGFEFYGNILHMLVEGQDGIEVVETGLISGITMPKRTVQEMVPSTYGDYYPSFGEDKKVVAFTYDDGPHHIYTQQILDVLAKHNVKATFFMLGSRVDAHPDIALQVAQAGHQVASHSYSHAPEHYLSALSGPAAAEQMAMAQNAIRNATGVDTRVLRPPGGHLDTEASLAGLPYVDAYVGWDIGTGDYMLPGADVLVNTVMDRVHPGSIVLMHDGGGDRAQTAEASDILIARLLSEGYTFVTIDELMEMMKEEIRAGW